MTFFDPRTDDILPDVQATYYKHLSTTGLSGLVVLGTNAETFLLTTGERKTLIQTARTACGPDFPIIAGCGAHSTRQVLQLMADAKGAGANYALVLPPAYFGKQSTPAVVERFFDEIAEKGQLPIILYNFPGVCNGVDLDSDIIAKLARRWPGKIVGVKLTCGSVAKIARLSAELSADKFAVFGGQSDFLIGGLASGSAGCICAFGNTMPKTVVKVYDLWQEGRHAEALKLHQTAALAERAVKAGIASVKYAAALSTAKDAGIANAEELLKPRHPYLPLTEDQKKAVRDTLAEGWKFEGTL